jgi:Tol biopolymer transport system component
MSIARDGTDLRIVVPLPRVPFKVSWAAQPLGGQRKIAFEGTVDYDGDGVHTIDEIDIFVANEDGTDVVNVTNTPDLMERHPDWSADGSRLAFARAVAPGAEEQDVIVADLAYVNGELVVTETNLTAGVEGDRLFGVHVSQPAWARHEDLVAVVAKDASGNFTQLWVLDPDDLAYGEELTAGHEDGQFVKQPCWSWDDALIVYQGSNDKYATGSLYTISRDGSTKSALYRREGRFKAGTYPLGLSMPIWRLQPPSTP